jgi:hypothetical protein
MYLGPEHLALPDETATRRPAAAPGGRMPRSYETTTPRVALGAAAIAMTTITLGLAVAIPTQVEGPSGEPRVLDASRAVPPELARRTTMGANAPAADPTDSSGRQSYGAQCTRTSPTDVAQHGKSTRPRRQRA